MAEMTNFQILCCMPDTDTDSPDDGPDGTP